MQNLRRQEKNCNLCQSHDSKYLFSVRSFNVVRCLNCGLSYLNPMPYPDDAAGLYTVDYYRSKDAEGDALLGYPDYLELQEHHTFVADELLHPLRDTSPGTVLDVGCGMGTMLGRFRALGWEAYGVDVSAYATDYARNELGLKVFTGAV